MYHYALKQRFTTSKNLGATSKCYAPKDDTKHVPYWGPKILGATLQNVVAAANLSPEFVHPCFKAVFPRWCFENTWGSTYCKYMVRKKIQLKYEIDNLISIAVLFTENSPCVQTGSVHEMVQEAAFLLLSLISPWNW
jgi:hypothetical protein